MADKNIENTLKKMAIVLDRVVKKIDELEERVSKLEQETLADKSKEDKAIPEKNLNIQPQASGFSSSGFGGGFLGSLLGSFAGMSLFNLLFSKDISAESLAKETGVDPESIEEIEQKLDNISQQIEDIEQEISEIEPSAEDTSIESDLEDLTDFGFDDTFDV